MHLSLGSLQAMHGKHSRGHRTPAAGSHDPGVVYALHGGGSFPLPLPVQVLVYLSVACSRGSSDDHRGREHLSGRDHWVEPPSTPVQVMWLMIGRTPLLHVLDSLLVNAVMGVAPLVDLHSPGASLLVEHVGGRLL